MQQWDERIERSRKIFTLIGLEGYDLNTEEFYNKSVESIQRAGPDDSGFTTNYGYTWIEK